MVAMANLAFLNYFLLSLLFFFQVSFILVLHSRNYFLFLSDICLSLLDYCFLICHSFFSSLFGSERVFWEYFKPLILNFSPLGFYSFIYLFFRIMISLSISLNFLNKATNTFLQNYFYWELELLILKTLDSLLLALSVDWIFRSRWTFK